MLEQIELSNENQRTTQRSKAIEYLKQLQSKPASIKLSRFLYKFSQKREVDSNTFINGIKQFISIANLSLQQRQSFYGDACAGLHYSLTLVNFFNKNNSKILHRYDLDFIASSDWQYITPNHINSSIALVYYGRYPAQALNKLLQGPTTIDCGMFCQLSIWFGIRYMLGDEQFNTVFGSTPLYITQYNYNAVDFVDNPYAGSPLFSFMSVPGEETTSNVSIEYIANTSFYPIKHPTGLSSGNNCIVIDDCYFIFAPHSEVNTGLTKNKVKQLLLHAFNEAPTYLEVESLQLFDTLGIPRPHKVTSTADPLRVTNNVDYKIWRYEDVTNMTLTQEEMDAEQDAIISVNFNLHKLQFFLQQMAISKHNTTNFLPLYDNVPDNSNDLLEQTTVRGSSSFFFHNNRKKSDNNKINAIKIDCC